MQIKRFVVQGCCGKTSVSLKIDRPISKDFLPLFISNGFIESTNFTKAGIFYVENESIRASGAFGTDRIQVQCKSNKSDCQEKLNDIEALLQQLG